MFHTILVHFANSNQKRCTTYLINFRFWKNFENFWFVHVLSGQRGKLTLKDVFIGKLEKSELLNYFLILVKLHILFFSGNTQKVQILMYLKI